MGELAWVPGRVPSFLWRLQGLETRLALLGGGRRGDAGYPFKGRATLLSPPGQAYWFGVEGSWWGGGMWRGY